MGGAMDSCGRFMKFSLILINAITFICGVVLLGVGGWVCSGRGFPAGLLSNNMWYASAVTLLVTGAAACLLSLLGCCGAAREVKCMLLTYYILVLIVLVTTLVGGVLQLVFRERIVETLDRELFAAVPFYGEKQEYTHAWDKTQSLLQCCGVRSYRDWNGNVPNSCCKELYPGQRLDCRNNPNPSNMYTEGCLDKTLDFLRENSVYVGAIAIVLALIMLLGLILSCGLFVKIE